MMEMQSPNPFQGLYEPLSARQADAYLARIGFDGEAEPTLECLTRLVDCQLHTVPFEDLDVFHGHREPALDTASLFDKIVRRRRGGYCFELNGLFWRLLEALGFRCWTVAVRIVQGRGYLPPLSHRAVLVEMQEGRYFCDVGFGGAAPVTPLPMTQAPAAHASGRHRYQFGAQGDWTVLSLEQEGSFIPMFLFQEKPCDPVDFIPLNANCSCTQRTRFVNEQIVSCLRRDGRASISGETLRIEKNGEITERALKTEEELRAALRDEFGLVYDEPLRGWCAAE